MDGQKALSKSTISASGNGIKRYCKNNNNNNRNKPTIRLNTLIPNKDKFFYFFIDDEYHHYHSDPYLIPSLSPFFVKIKIEIIINEKIKELVIVGDESI